jgi:hypothetical protein
MMSGAWLWLIVGLVILAMAGVFAYGSYRSAKARAERTPVEEERREEATKALYRDHEPE